jgi:hypothetical protein
MKSSPGSTDPTFSAIGGPLYFTIQARPQNGPSADLMESLVTREKCRSFYSSEPLGRVVGLY